MTKEASHEVASLSKGEKLFLKYGVEEKFFIINRKFVDPGNMDHLEGLQRIFNPHGNFYVAFNVDEPYAERLLAIMGQYHDRMRPPIFKNSWAGVDAGNLKEIREVLHDRHRALHKDNEHMLGECHKDDTLCPVQAQINLLDKIEVLITTMLDELEDDVVNAESLMDNILVKGSILSLMRLRDGKEDRAK